MAHITIKADLKNWYDLPEDELARAPESPFIGVTGAGKSLDYEGIERQAMAEFYGLIKDNDNKSDASGKS